MAATKSQSEVDKLGWLMDADPKQDLELALSDSDERFIGIYGFGLIVPIADSLCLDFKTDVKFIDGTAEARSGYEHAKLNSIAEVYARYYNVLLISHLEKEGRLHGCED